MNQPLTSDILRQAVAAHQAGRLGEARAGYELVLAGEPDHGWANYFRAVLADAEGDGTLALDCLRRAARAGDPPVQALVALGNRELTNGQALAALAAFETATRLRPNLAAAFTGCALALKRLGRLADAMAAGRRALELRRGWRPGATNPPGQLDPAEVAEMRRANRIKLAHDAAQLRHLTARDVMIPQAQRIASGYEHLLGELRALPDDTTVVTLDDRALAATLYAYNRLLHLPPTSVPNGGPLAADTDFAAADRAFEKCRPLVIDDVLSGAALEELQRFSRDATIWFEVKDHGGHLGAYFEEGLACELLIATADALREALPRNLKRLGLAQLWAYKHIQGGSGTDLHADMGEISANLWITPDQASLDPQGGGIEIWPVRMPEDWDFKHANVKRDGIRNFLAGKGDPIVIPHRCNRLVLFEAKLFHRTSPGSFKSGYENRRVNITFLYDRMEATSGGHVG